MSQGHLDCPSCGARFPILAGVAILVDDVAQYIFDHAKGIARVVADSEIPEEYREAFLEAKGELGTEHIEEDLEAERVTSLYVMNHYLRVGAGREEWWKPLAGANGKGESAASGAAVGDPLIDRLVREYWDHGPIARIGQWVSGELIELGCGVGGVQAALRGRLSGYLGVDSSFASIALARHLALGFPYPAALRIPGDLLEGPVSRPIGLPAAPPCDGRADFVVGDLASPPLRRGLWDRALALNAIDMLEDPAALPRLQFELLKKDGEAIQGCPYVWHPAVAEALRAELPEGIRDSAEAVEWLYARAGLQVEERVRNLPWLFFKHVRQLEVYSVHLFRAARKQG